MTPATARLVGGFAVAVVVATGLWFMLEGRSTAAAAGSRVDAVVERRPQSLPDLPRAFPNGRADRVVLLGSAASVAADGLSPLVQVRENGTVAVLRGPVVASAPGRPPRWSRAGIRLPTVDLDELGERARAALLTVLTRWGGELGAVDRPWVRSVAAGPVDRPVGAAEWGRLARWLR